MSGHTPGPWSVHQTEDVTGIECQELTALNGLLTGMALIYSDEDANLIAAAPDLLETLEDFVNAMSQPILIIDTAKAKAVIARAKGEA